MKSSKSKEKTKLKSRTVPDDLKDSATAVFMVKHGLPLTRENFLRLMWGHRDITNPYPAELEAELPRRFQEPAPEQ